MSKIQIDTAIPRRDAGRKNTNYDDSALLWKIVLNMEISRRRGSEDMD